MHKTYTFIVALILLGIFVTLLVVGLLGKKELIAPLSPDDPAAKLAGLLAEKKIDIVSSPVASDSALLVTLLPSETVVWLSTTKDLTTQISSLQIILNKLTIDRTKAKKIDLRFSDPIVVY